MGQKLRKLRDEAVAVVSRTTTPANEDNKLQAETVNDDDDAATKDKENDANTANTAQQQPGVVVVEDKVNAVFSRFCGQRGSHKDAADNGS